MTNGDKMDRKSPRSVFKEIRLNLEPTSQGSTVAIRLPSHGTSIFPARATQKRSNVVEIPVAEDEETFRQRHLATASSVYHRIHNSSPRSFLWRVLENGKVLSIQSVDISKPNKKVPDAHLTLRLTFPSAIAPSCIAFSDPQSQDFLSVHVLTQSNHLYTLNLRPELFRKTSSTDETTASWCKSYLSSAFSFKHPLRLVALNAEELLVSLIDGGLLRLSRKPGGDGSEWKEVFYNEGGWSHSLRSLIPFQGSNTTPYGKLNIELSAVTSVAYPNTNLDNMPYVYTVSVDHRLRVWNLKSGKLAYMKDMLTGELNLNDIKKQVIDPSLSQLVKVFGQDEKLLCVTFSPLEIGQFKFWRPRKLNDSSVEMEDMFPMVTLEPQPPTSELWTLADFSVIEGKDGTFSIWTLWKNNTTYRVHALDFTAGDSADVVRQAWSKNWTAVATETIRETPHPTSSPGDSLDISDKWLEYILAPGRYTIPTIETGLCIWESNSGPSKDFARKSASLPERMCSSIGSFNTLGRAADGKMDYAQLRAAAEQQWLRFYRLLEELDKQRGEAQSLAVGSHGMPCVILADGIAPIRECSPLEDIWHNSNIRTRETIHIAAPIVAASEFRDTFSAPFFQSCRSMLLSEISEEPLLTVPARMRAFYDKCGFGDQVDDEAFAQLGDRLKEFGDGFHDITPEVYQALIDLMATEQTLRAGDLPLGNFGMKLVVRGVQEIVELHRNVCLDQILLLILLEAEVIHSEDGTPFETAEIYEKFLEMLQKLELVDWLVRTQISSSLDTRERSNSVSEQSSKKDGPSHDTVSVLGGIFRPLFSLPNVSMTRAMTQTILDICSPLSTYEASPAAIQCFLLGKGRADLAMDFNRFTESDPFSIYIQGRVCLASKDPQAASLLFKKAAFGLSYSDPNRRTEYRSAGYISEIERNLLNAGLPSYYSHIVALYEEEKHYSFVVDFSRLALQFIKPGSKDDEESRLRTEMHSRLFNAAIETFLYDTAYSVLTLFTNHILQISSLKKLVTHMCDNSYASELVAFPFIGLQDEVDEILAHKCLSIVDVKAGIPYHKILYAWRIKRSDFRGAASISLERLQKLILSGEGDKPINDNSLETHVTKQYVTLINALCCVDSKQAWILHEEQPSKGASWNAKEPKRKVVTLEDIRREYQAELDRIAAIENNQFSFGDEMDVL